MLAIVTYKTCIPLVSHNWSEHVTAWKEGLEYTGSDLSALGALIRNLAWLTKTQRYRL